MSFKTNQTQQITLNDSFINQTPRTQKMIMNSWCKDFADIVFPAIKEDRFSVLYSDIKNSRPNTPINIIVGALILKESNGLNDDELLESICCDVRYQYALHTTHLAEQPVSDRTFSRFRARLYDYERESGENLLNDEMMHLSEVFRKYMNLNSNIKRMDSLMIASRCKRMSRLEIIYSTLEKTTTNRAIKIQVPIYLPQKLSKKTGQVNGINYRDMFLNHLIKGEAYQVEILKRNNKYYCHITFEVPKQDIVYTGHNGMIGIDTNPDGFALTMINNKGNYKWHTYLKQHELLYARTNRRENLCGELVRQYVDSIRDNRCISYCSCDLCL